MSGSADRLNLFEPLLDELMAVFGLEASFAALVPEDPVFEAYNRCEAKRFKIGEACAVAPESVQENADLIMHAIAHDHCPSGDRQLIEPLTAALGPRRVMELILWTISRRARKPRSWVPRWPGIGLFPRCITRRLRNCAQYRHGIRAS